MDSGIREIFACGIQNMGNLLVESGTQKILLVESGLLGFGIRNPTINWNPESRSQVLLTNTGIQ